jgi:hypothetical protein
MGICADLWSVVTPKSNEAVMGHDIRRDGCPVAWDKRRSQSGYRLCAPGDILTTASAES